MAEEMDNILRKELERILSDKDTDDEELPCRYYRLVPPPGCILGWDISQCNLCSFYRPIGSKDEN